VAYGVVEARRVPRVREREVTNQPVVAELSRYSGRTQLYVSRGTGFWGPPLRVFAPSEITVLTLRP
jgi:predicted MPP superfamily phosphohydrolase